MSEASLVCDHLHDVQHFTTDDVNKRVQAALEACRERGVRFTSLRQQVYELILQANEPVGAYEVITQLQQLRLAETADRTIEVDNREMNSAINNANSRVNDSAKKQSPKNVAPPTVYRSLEFLLSEGLIHQLTSINAYVPCCHPRAEHTAAFLICDSCLRVQECSSLPVQEIMSFAEQDVGFMVTRSVIELRGRCQTCH